MISERRTCIAIVLFGLIVCSSLAMTTAAVLPHNPRQQNKKPATAGAGQAAAETVALGKKVYTANCAVCHAVAGKGGAVGPDLTATGAVPSHTVRWLADQVANPKSHTPESTMPAFAGKIKERDMTALVTFLSSLKGRQAATSATGAPSVRVARPDPAAVAKIEKLGGSVQQVAQTDDRLEVSFHLLGTAVTDGSLVTLAGLKHLIHLDLGQTAVSDAGLAHIRGLTELTELHLEGTKVTDNGLAHLANLHSLAYLNLYGTQITDAGLDHLTGLTGLRHLYVWQTKVTQAGADKLKKALPQVEIVMGWDQAPKK